MSVYNNHGGTLDQRALADYMSDISEDCYCANWMRGLEYALWEVVIGERVEYGMAEVSPEDRGELQELSDRCGGWIYWSDAKNPETGFSEAETWVPLDKWRDMFDAHRTGRKP